MLELNILDDSGVQNMRDARKAPAVLKLRLASIRSLVPEMLVFAFEGKDDKTVYYHWIKRVRPDLEYEPFPCDGKEQVLLFREMLDRDRGGLNKGVYFCVDRDFDDLRGRGKAPELFMTDKYSVENYLVTEGVLDDLLKNEYHCHGQIERRREICAIFSQAYGDFLQVTAAINWRLFLIRKLGIRLKDQLPDKIAKIAKVSIFRAESNGVEPSQIVKAEREPKADESDQFLRDFQELKAGDRYRGKFSLLFFMKWLEELALDRNAEVSKIFKQEANSRVRFQNITLDSLAVKSKLPDGFADFILRAK